MTLFDRYVMVDWSAASTPTRGADSIWQATLDVPADAHVDAVASNVVAPAFVVNHPTRTEARDALRALLHDSLAAGRRVLVGFDVPYGYPVGTAAALGLELATSRPAWRAMWDAVAGLVRDDLDGAPNRNDRFDVAATLNGRIGDPDAFGPFWGCPAHLARAPLSPRKLHAYPYPYGAAETSKSPAAGLAELRRAELALRSVGTRPFSVWQLAGAGAVGSQTLTALPVLLDLVTDPVLAARSHVWPFTTGLVADPTSSTRWMAPGVIVHAEIWPGAIRVPDRDDPVHGHPVKDARQVAALCRWAAAHDRAGTLGSLFAPVLDPAAAADVVTEEGWVLWDPSEHRALRG